MVLEKHVCVITIIEVERNKTEIIIKYLKDIVQYTYNDNGKR